MPKYAYIFCTITIHEHSTKNSLTQYKKYAILNKKEPYTKAAACLRIGSLPRFKAVK